MNSSGTGRHTGAVLSLLRELGPVSRTRLADEADISASTITKVVTPLLDAGWVEEAGPGTGSARVGRPAVPIRQVPGAVSALGIQIGLGVARVGTTDALGVTTESRTIPLDEGVSAAVALDRAMDAAEDVLARTSAPCVGVGLAAPGAVDHDRRSVMLSLNLGWRDVPAAAVLEDRLGLPAVVDQNVRAMALAEARFGGHGVDNLAYIYAGSGVGLGVVLQGKPFWGGGNHGGVIQLGHTRVAGGNERCVCGAHGCLETVVSAPAIERLLRRAGVELEDTTVTPVLTQLERRRFDPSVSGTRNDVVEQLSRGIANVINLLDPGLVLLGGSYAEAPPSLLADVRATVQQEIFPLLRADLRLEAPRLATPEISAGAALALESFYYSELAEASLESITSRRAV